MQQKGFATEEKFCEPFYLRSGPMRLRTNEPRQARKGAAVVADCVRCGVPGLFVAPFLLLYPTF